MNREIKIEWSYIPKSFLETEYSLDFDSVKINFDNGEITIHTDEINLQNNPFFVTNAEKTIRNFLNGISIYSHASYKLFRKPIKHYKDDGSFRQTAVIESIVEKVTVSGHVEFQVVDKDGNVIRDSKKERNEEKKTWGYRVSRADGQTQKLIDSYLSAINDKDNEIVHLYEIRDYVSKKLGGNEKARKSLSIPKSDWNLLGKVANELPILEGRHRGKHFDILREATKEELNSARMVAKTILMSYLKHLESIT